ncbi:GNAT family N-acetyltransferase [Henriciella aquimarina]|uniref:GNAT family N-acetyltransferase n=1 Tax=Henriciella aquimarina TaxID=545261 RepID=UPI0009FFF3AC|nr:N-acetyltransferase [Henriciella aquimarina]
MIEILPETPAIHAEAIEDLFDRTFGPGHFAKTAERLREYSASVPEVNRVAVLDGKVIAVCRVWPLVVGERRDKALFYGPVAVAQDHRGDRLGLRVTEAAIEAGIETGWPAAVLIGAPAYFGEIGFSVTPHGRLTFPGPQDQSRVMVRNLAGDAGQLEGLVTAA